MTTARCPKCSRLTYSKKWNSCTADGCALNHSVLRVLAALRNAPPTSVTPPHLVVRPEMIPVVEQLLGAPFVPAKAKGRPKVHVTPAERQRAYRARKKAVV